LKLLSFKLRWFFLASALFAALFLQSGRAHAQEELIAVVITGNLSRYETAHEMFVKEMESLGYKTDAMKIYVQRPNPDPVSWANSIRKAVGIGADIVVTYGAPATLAAKTEARSIPIVFVDVYDPVGLGIIRNSAHPEGNLTGMGGQTPLETLVQAYDTSNEIRKMGVLFSPQDQGSVFQVKKLADIAEKKGFSLLQVGISTSSDVWEGLQTLGPHIDSLFVSESALLEMSVEKIIAFSRKNKIPIISQIPGLCEKGALMTLEADPAEQGTAVAGYVSQLIEGKKPGDLPVRTPRKVALVINLKAAQEFNLKIPFQALTLATRVIH